MCVREHDWGIESRNSTGHNLGGDALECWDQLTQDSANTKEDDRNGHTELQTLGNGLHDEVAHVSGTALKSLEGFFLAGAGQK